MEAEVGIKVFFFFLFLGFAWWYFSSEKDTNRIMQQNMKLMDGNVKSVTRQLEDLKESNAALRTTILKYRTDVEEIQEHCAKLRESQQRLTKNQSYLKERMLPQKYEISIVEPTKEVKKIIKPDFRALKKKLDEFSQ